MDMMNLLAAMGEANIQDVDGRGSQLRLRMHDQSTQTVVITVSFISHILSSRGCSCCMVHPQKHRYAFCCVQLHWVTGAAAD